MSSAERAGLFRLDGERTRAFAPPNPAHARSLLDFPIRHTKFLVFQFDHQGRPLPCKISTTNSRFVLRRQRRNPLNNPLGYVIRGTLGLEPAAPKFQDPQVGSSRTALSRQCSMSTTLPVVFYSPPKTPLFKWGKNGSVVGVQIVQCTLNLGCARRGLKSRGSF